MSSLRLKCCYVALLACASAAVFAQNTQAFPNKPIRVVVPVPAGGTPDGIARIVAPSISNLLGQQVVIDNRGGAGGLIGAEFAARAAPDGYTLFISSKDSLTITPNFRTHVPYDTLKDFAPISLIAAGPFLLITNPSVPVKSVQGLINLAKAQPGKLNYASAGNGAANHLAMELFKGRAGMNVTHVPYKGAPPAVTDLLGGYVDVMFMSIPPVLQHVKAGRLRLLGVSSTKRSSQLPDYPTISEAGVPGFEFNTWFGLLAPAKTPRAILARLHEVVVKVILTPDIRVQLEIQGTDPVSNSPEEFAALIRAELESYGNLVKRSGMKMD